MKIKLLLLMLFVVLNIIIFIFTEINKSQKINVALSLHKKQLNVSYKTVKYHQEIVVKNTIQYVKNTSMDILNKISDASEKEKYILRKKLFNRLLDRYKEVKSSGVYQFQFTLPDNKTFLRMHKPNMYGDDLTGVRYSIEKVNKTKKSVSGFEGGKTTHAYRYVYPLFNDLNEYIAAIEVSFSSDYIQKYLTSIENIHSHLLIKKEVFSKKEWEKEQKKDKYHESSENSDFMFLITSQHKGEVCIIDNKKKLKNFSKMIKIKIEEGKSFNFYTKHKDKEHYINTLYDEHIDVITFLPIKNTDGNISSWIVSYTFDNYISETLKYTTIIRLVLFIALAILMALIYKILSQRNRLAIKVEEKTDEINRYFNLITDGIAIVDTDTNKFVDCNKSFEKLTGYSKDELVLLEINKIHPKESLSYVVREFEAQAKKEKMIALNIPILHKDGNTITMVDISTDSYKKNKQHLNIGIFRNIEDRLILENKLLDLNKNLEDKVSFQIEKLRQKDNLLFQQSKLAAMGEMLGNIAHQWRQPLSAISSIATGTKIQKEINCLSDKDLISSLDNINHTVQYLSETIEDFRNFFNPNNGGLSEFDVELIIDKTLKLMSSQLSKNETEVILNVENYRLLSYENELIQVLINILNNARDALLKKEDNERKLIFINAYKKENRYCIEMLDSAGGVHKDILERIFEPYFTTKHQSQGTGIGLYMSEEIVKKHLHGTLSVKNENYEYGNEKFQGAKFSIQIPINR